jgi:hypothetical protein
MRDKDSIWKIIYTVPITGLSCEGIYSFRMPKPNGWTVYLYGKGTSCSTQISLMDDTKPPCWFHRLMQKWILGFIWVKK